MVKKLFLLFILCSSLQTFSNEAFDQDTKHLSVSINGGWSKVSEDYGFGGNKGHLGFDLMLFFNKNWFININLDTLAMGKSANTTLTQAGFHLGAGYRYKGLRGWLGLGGTTQSKEISSPNFYYVDPAPKTTSIVTVDDQFASWAAAIAYDFIITKPVESFPWYFAIGPHVMLTDTFTNNGFDPVYSAGITLSLL